MNSIDRARRNRAVFRHALGWYGPAEPRDTAENWDEEKNAAYDQARAAYEEKRRQAAAQRRKDAGEQQAG